MKFVKAFKHAWFSLYFPDFEHRLGNFDDLDKYITNPNLYQKAINFTKQFVLMQGDKFNLREDFEKMYNQLAAAYCELYKYSPNAHLDLNDGNIGFTSQGTLKVFDMQ